MARERIDSVVYQSTLTDNDSFFRVQEYPPFLLFLLMTLWAGALFLAFMDRFAPPRQIPSAFGRVPMFYYILHWYAIHSLAIVLGGLRYGRWDFLWQLAPSISLDELFMSTRQPPDRTRQLLAQNVGGWCSGSGRSGVFGVGH